jgi:hypothetical protein
MKRSKAGASKAAPAKPAAEPAKVKKAEDAKPAAPPPAAKPVAVKKEEDSDGEVLLGWPTLACFWPSPAQLFDLGMHHFPTDEDVPLATKAAKAKGKVCGSR